MYIGLFSYNIDIRIQPCADLYSFLFFFVICFV